MKKMLSKVLVFILALAVTFVNVSAASSMEYDAYISVKNKTTGELLERIGVNYAAASDSIQKALDLARDNASKNNPISVILPQGNYIIRDTLNIYSNTIFDLSDLVNLYRQCNAAMIRFGRSQDVSSGYNGYENITILGSPDEYTLFDGGNGTRTILRFAHAKNVNIEYIEFKNVRKAHHLEFAACDTVTIDNCKFNDYYPTDEEDAYNHEAIQLDVLTSGHFPDYSNYDKTTNKNITIKNSLFENVNRGVGVHSGLVGKYMDNIKIINNTFINANGYAIVGTNFINSEIKNNVIENCGSGISFRHITPSNVNYYGYGTNETISTADITTNMNCVISDNTISLKSTSFENTRYGINIYGKVVSKNTNANKTVIPKADYRVGNITIKNNKIQSTTYANGIWLQGAIDSSVSNNSVSYNISKKENDQCDGIKLEDSSNISVKNNTVTENSTSAIARSGIYVRNTSDATISNNTIKQLNQDGIYLYSSKKVSINNNAVTGVKKHGIYVDKNSGTSKKYIGVTSNNVSSVGDRGICINDKSYATVSSNAISNNGGEGIYIGAGATAKITSNTVTSSGTHGICITNSSSAPTVETNTVTKAGDIGIYINQKATATKVYKNSITSPKGQGIYFNNGASGTSLSSNTISSSGGYGVFIKGSTLTDIASNTIKSGDRGVNISGSTVTTIKSNSISNSSSEGINITDKSKVTDITSNKISSSKKHGVHLTNSSVCKNVKSNSISSSGENGIYVKDKASVTTLQSNTITDCADYAIRVKDATVSTINKNTIQKSKKKKTSAKDGIFVSGKKAKASTISSNKISYTKGHGIHISDSATSGKVEKNTLSTIGGHGIYVKTKANAKAITGNSISNAKECGIAIYSKSGTYSVKSNTVKKCGETGLDICKDAKVTASDNSFSSCKEYDVRIQSKKSKKCTTEKFKITKVNKSKKTIVVSLSGASGVDKYIVYRSTKKSKGYKKIGITTTTSYTDKKVTKGKTYYYKVVPYAKYSKATVEFKPSAVKSIKYK